VAKPGKKREWCIEVHVRATEDEAEDIVERLGAAICPDPFHPGYCRVPWAIQRLRPRGKAAKRWKKYFREERAAAEAAGDVPRDEPPRAISP